MHAVCRQVASEADVWARAPPQQQQHMAASPSPSEALRLLAKQLNTLRNVLQPILHPEEVSYIFGRVAAACSETLAATLDGLAPPTAAEAAPPPPSGAAGLLRGLGGGAAAAAAAAAAAEAAARAAWDASRRANALFALQVLGAMPLDAARASSYTTRLTTFYTKHYGLLPPELQPAPGARPAAPAPAPAPPPAVAAGPVPSAAPARPGGGSSGGGAADLGPVVAPQLPPPMPEPPAGAVAPSAAAATPPPPPPVFLHPDAPPALPPGPGPAVQGDHYPRAGAGPGGAGGRSSQDGGMQAGGEGDQQQGQGQQQQQGDLVGTLAPPPHWHPLEGLDDHGRQEPWGKEQQAEQEEIGGAAQEVADAELQEAGSVGAPEEGGLGSGAACGGGRGGSGASSREHSGGGVDAGGLGLLGGRGGTGDEEEHRGGVEPGGGLGEELATAWPGVSSFAHAAAEAAAAAAGSTGCVEGGAAWVNGAGDAAAGGSPDAGETPLSGREHGEPQGEQSPGGAGEVVPEVTRGTVIRAPEDVPGGEPGEPVGEQSPVEAGEVLGVTHGTVTREPGGGTSWEAKGGEEEAGVARDAMGMTHEAVASAAPGGGSTVEEEEEAGVVLSPGVRTSHLAQGLGVEGLAEEEQRDQEEEEKLPAAAAGPSQAPVGVEQEGPAGGSGEGPRDAVGGAEGMGQGWHGEAGEDGGAVRAGLGEMEQGRGGGGVEGESGVVKDGFERGSSGSVSSGAVDHPLA